MNILSAALIGMLAVGGARAADTPDTAPPQAARAASAAVQQAEPAVTTPQSAPKSAKPGKGEGQGKPARAMDRLELDRTQITGNRELPKVMVIVPWKRSDIGDLVGRPANSLVDEALQPVDREVFRRELDYYDALAPERARGETRVTGGGIAPQPEK